MVKSKININANLLALISIAWFLAVSFITAQTEYQKIIADTLGDPQGISTQFESFLTIFIVILTFIPSGLLLSYSYVTKNFKKHEHRIARIILLSFLIACALFIVFSWYDFIINFAR